MKTKKKWIKFRHKVITAIAYAVLTPYCKLAYGLTIDPFRGDRKRQYLIVMNHQTPLDQFFVGIAFKKCIYYLASEDLFSNGFISKLLRWAVAPIPIKKQTVDIGAVRNCMRVVKEGGSIALAPEGNRTYSGRTGYIKPSVVKFIRALGLPVAVLRIEGGYGVQPRWSDVTRKGKMRAYVSKVIEPEEYAKMSNGKLFDIISKEMYVDEAIADSEFLHKNNAEFLERVIYVCHECGLSEFESEGDIIICKRCGKKVRHMPNKELHGVNCIFPFIFVADWYEYQCKYVSQLEIKEGEHLYKDIADLWQVNLYRNKMLLKESAVVDLYYDKIVIGDIVARFSEDTAVTVLGRNKLNIYIGDMVYQLKGGKRFNAVKYVNLYNHYKNVSEGKINEQFLGL